MFPQRHWRKNKAQGYRKNKTICRYCSYEFTSHIRNGKHDSDFVYFFQSGPTEINGKKIDKIEILVRPSKYIREIRTRRGTITHETKQARTKIEITSPDLPTGEASIRIDPSYKDSYHNFVFDIVLGSDEKNVIDQTKLPFTAQTAGHHFTSEVASDDFGLQPFQIHEGIAARLNSLT